MQQANWLQKACTNCRMVILTCSQRKKLTLVTCDVCYCLQIKDKDFFNFKSL